MSKNYLVTGVTSGIGEALSYALLSNGNKVFGIGRDEKKVEMLRNEFPEHLKFLSIDLSAEIGDFEFIDDFVSQNGKFNGMIYCAGKEETLPIILYSQDKVKSLFNVNFNAALQLLRILSKKKNSEDSSSFIFLSSVMGELGQPGKTAYCSSKAAILGLVKAAALELSNRRIRVNAISPGVVETPMTAKLFDQIGPEGKEKILSMHPLGFGKVQDIIPLIEFLLSENSKWITGQNFKVDGGYSIQ